MTVTGLPLELIILTVGLVATAYTVLGGFKAVVWTDVVQVVMLWNTTNLGYLTVQAATLAARGALADGATSIDAGRLGAMDVRGSEVLLGDPLVMTKANIDQFDF